MVNFELFSNILRATLYVLTSFFFILLSNFYFQAFKRSRKENKILENFINLFFWLGIFFFAMFLVPVLRIFNFEAYLFLTRHFYFFAFPVLWYIRKVWLELWNDEKNNNGKGNKKVISLKEKKI